MVRKAFWLLPLFLNGCHSSPPNSAKNTPLETVSTVTLPSTPDVISYYEQELFRRISSPLPHALRLDVSRSGTFKRPPSFALVEDRSLPPARVAPAPGLTALASFAKGVLATSERLELVGHDISLQARISPGGTARLEIQLGERDRVFGLGDKVKGTNRRGHEYELWNTDAFGYDENSDPLYKSIPFVLILDEERAYGIFVDTSARGAVDVGKHDPETLTFEFADTNTLSTFVFTGSPREILGAYTELTGRTPLPPLWALGYHQSRYGYLTEDAVRSVVQRFSEEELPLDAIWLDIDFQHGNAPFTVDRAAFPRFDEMIRDFEERHVRTVVITDPHIKSYQAAGASSGYAPYESGAAGDHFIHGPSGFFEGEVWPGKSVFPDFTLTRTRSWWGTLYEDFVRQGVHGFWNDMNEPALFVEEKTMPSSVHHRFDDGSTLAHAHVHNAYGLLNARSTYEGLLRLRPNERPFILTRAASAGAQRFAASWTGDNTANRQHLALSIAQLNNLGVSGYAFVGADVGGFVGCPDEKLLVSWMELGAYQPFFRNHSQKESCRREPWVFGESNLAKMRRALRRRYELLPYLYTAFEEASRTGVPVVRPLWFEYPHDSGSLDAEHVFLLGRDLLILPELTQGSEPLQVYLPPGRWIEWKSGAIHEGQRTISVERSGSSSMHEFVRAGSIIPQTAPLTSSHELRGAPLDLHVFPGPSCTGTLYSDDGHTFAYRSERGRRRLRLTCTMSSGRLHITSESTGAGPAFWSAVNVIIHDRARSFGTASLQQGTNDAQSVRVARDRAEGTLVHLPGGLTDFSLILAQ